MQSLQVLIDILTKGRKLHINIMDVNGVLNTSSTNLRFENIIHSKKFCCIAKSTDKGYRLCMYCKKKANAKALTEKQVFGCHCLFGIFEITVPVILNETVVAIIFVGNAVIDAEESKKRIDKICRYTGVDRQQLYEQLDECEHIHDTDELLQIAEIISDYLKMLYTTAPKATHSMHWLVDALKQYADCSYFLNPTLKEVSIIYSKNEKYLGRLFKKEMHLSFHEYCLNLKLNKAKDLLLTTTNKIIDISLECGFDNISYFNRTFKKHFGMSPREYVASEKNNFKG